MDENNLNLQNNEVTPEEKPEVKPEEVTNFSVTENNSWDAQGQFSGQPVPTPAPAPAPMPAPMPGVNPGPSMNGAPNMQIPPAPPVPGQFGPQPGPNPNMQGGPAPIPGSFPPPAAPQPPYQAPRQPFTPAAPVDPNQEMTTKEWFLTLFLSYIPIAGLVLMIIWAVEQNPLPKYRHRKNWATANLIWVVIRYVLAMILSYALAFMITELIELLM
ncbi:hypothetical protein [Butyrivibrio sp. MC2021]|uniref:hypothetical protein n=1 Tax=Butyrivibrio sp. MC2021 TaxID=1408306 RepID=UPI00047D2171|nr:hypothetical protein [Butyrivibrio sp. MC2021]